MAYNVNLLHISLLIVFQLRCKRILVMHVFIITVMIALTIRVTYRVFSEDVLVDRHRTVSM